MGFEPMPIGTAISGLEHLTLPATLYYSILNFLCCGSCIGTVISIWRGLDHLTIPAIMSNLTIQF